MFLEQLREIVWRCNLELPRNGLVKMTSGNVSGRDPETGLVEKYEPGPIDDVHHGYWKTDARDPNSTVMMAALAMLVHELGYDPDAGATGRMLLENVTEEQTDDFIYTSKEQMPPAERDNPPPRFFSTRVVAFWLDAYWRGKLLRLY